MNFTKAVMILRILSAASLLGLVIALSPWDASFSRMFSVMLLIFSYGLVEYVRGIAYGMNRMAKELKK